MMLYVCCDFTFSTKIQTLLLAFVLLLHHFTLIKCNFENSEDREDARRSQDNGKVADAQSIFLISVVHFKGKKIGWTFLS